MIAKSLLERGTQADRHGFADRVMRADRGGDCVVVVCDEQGLNSSLATGDWDAANDGGIPGHVLRALAEYGDVATETTLGDFMESLGNGRDLKKGARTIDSLLAASRLDGGREMRVDDVLIPSRAGVSACPPVIIVVYRSDDASRVRSDSGSVGFNPPLRREPEAELFPALTPREREVLQLILEGFPNKNIAADLQISMRTVENHRASIMKKTGSKSLAALVRFAMRAGDMQASPSQVRQ